MVKIQLHATVEKQVLQNIILIFIPRETEA